MQQKIKLKLVTKDYDFFAPLACGDVVVEGIDLKFERDTANALDRTLADRSIDAGELSLSRQLARLASGDLSFVGIPVFPQRVFRHRCFFVRRDSGLNSFEQLAGKRIGCNEWPASGNTWSRAILRNHGVKIEGISWLVGSIDGKPSSRPQGDLPPHVRAVTDKTLLSMLLSGELDALMCPHPPKGFDDHGSSVVRLIPNYRQVEMDYYRRTGIFPIIHVIGVRRQVYEKHPWVLTSLFKALDESKKLSMANRKKLSDTTPWLIAEIEDATALFGKDYYPYGIEHSRKVIQALCDEQFAQGLISERVDGAIAFPEFEAAMTSKSVR
jgi:4,5-dihydroxyphthalate decarboxylase